MKNMKELKSVMKTFVELWRNKKFSEDGLVMCGIMAGSEEAHNNYGPTQKGFEKLIELTKNANDEMEVINSFVKTAKLVD